MGNRWATARLIGAMITALLLMPGVVVAQSEQPDGLVSKHSSTNARDPEKRILPESTSNDEEPGNGYGVRFTRKFSMRVSAAAGAIIPAFTVAYNVTPRIEVGLSGVMVAAILAFEARGLMMHGRFYLPPGSSITPFLSAGVGPLWKERHGRGSLEGIISSVQFGWDYSSDFGLSAFLAVGPVLTFVTGEKVSGGLIHIGVGWRF